MVAGWYYHLWNDRFRFKFTKRIREVFSLAELFGFLSLFSLSTWGQQNSCHVIFTHCMFSDSDRLRPWVCPASRAGSPAIAARLAFLVCLCSVLLLCHRRSRREAADAWYRLPHSGRCQHPGFLPCPPWGVPRGALQTQPGEILMGLHSRASDKLHRVG